MAIDPSQHLVEVARGFSTIARTADLLHAPPYPGPVAVALRVMGARTRDALVGEPLAIARAPNRCSANIAKIRRTTGAAVGSGTRRWRCRPSPGLLRGDRHLEVWPRAERGCRSDGGDDDGSGREDEDPGVEWRSETVPAGDGAAEEGSGGHGPRRR